MSEFTQAFDAYQGLYSEVKRGVVMPDQDLGIVIGAVLLGEAVLLEGGPGTGKTTLANRIAKGIGGSYSRVQGTPDVMASDVTGSEIYRQNNEDFEFVPGPIFSNVLLLDEFNRAPAKTQSAVLEGMQEKQVTVNGTTYELPDPFIVLATQNPSENTQGTNPLTLATIDRFAVGLTMKPLTKEEMIEVVDLNPGKTKEIVTPSDVQEIRDEILPEIEFGLEAKKHTAALIDRVRELEAIDQSKTVLEGARPMQKIRALAQITALAQRRRTVGAADIDFAASYVLPHRVGLGFAARKNGLTSKQVVTDAIRG